jgi:hypothetical protein
VLQLLDGYSRCPAEGLRATFRLDDEVVRPLVKPQAFHAFIGLEARVYPLRIETRDFFPFEGRLQVPLARPLAQAILACPLEPGPLYPFPARDGVVRGLVTRSGRPLAGVEVKASYTGRGNKPVSRRTRTWAGGRYDGRYALSFGDRLRPDTEVAIEFAAPGGAPSRRKLRLSAGASVFLDVELN